VCRVGSSFLLFQFPRFARGTAPCRIVTFFATVFLPGFAFGERLEAYGAHCEIGVGKHARVDHDSPPASKSAK